MTTAQKTNTETLRHVSRLTDDRGIFEHALGVHPRLEHGYCTDDNARLLVLAVRGKAQSKADILEEIAARFLLDAMSQNGQVHNRLSFERTWQDAPSTNDCWGRALWGLGVAIAESSNAELREKCYDAFNVGAQERSYYLRSRCFASIGAAEVLRVDSTNKGALGLVVDASEALKALSPMTPEWLWHEERLTYANALIPEAMICCGVVLDDETLVQRGLELLEWLVLTETKDNHLSVTPVGGRSQSDEGGRFDQQPIEVAALADAARRAFGITHDIYWKQVVDLSISWFLGNNDAGLFMIDLESGGGYDGLEFGSVNRNQGAESTLAMLSTLQRRSSLRLV